MTPPGPPWLFAPELVEAGANWENLDVVAIAGSDLHREAELIGDELRAERADQVVLAGVWIGGAVACLVGLLAAVASVHDAGEVFAVICSFFGFVGSALAAYTFLERAKATTRRLDRIRHVLVRWST